MKKYFLILVSLSVVAIGSMSLTGNKSDSAGSTIPSAGYTETIPDTVNAIFEKSCYPCHSEPGKGMAMSKLNFDKWADYKPEKQADKADDICKEMTKGSMPPKSYKTNNPEKVPTEAEVKIVCDWAASFGKK